MAALKQPAVSTPPDPLGPPPDLVAAARAAFQNAYAPYSSFQVGAALRTAQGAVIQGANVENASYGLTRCAEQSAVQAMVSRGERNFTTIVVYTESAEPAPPCGACRQIMQEFAPDATVHLVNHLGAAKSFQVSELLPGAFRLDK